MSTLGMSRFMWADIMSKSGGVQYIRDIMIQVCECACVCVCVCVCVWGINST